jgi:hypothetical protein
MVDYKTDVEVRNKIGYVVYTVCAATITCRAEFHVKVRVCCCRRSVLSEGEIERVPDLHCTPGHLRAAIMRMCLAHRTELAMLLLASRCAKAGGQILYVQPCEYSRPYDPICIIITLQQASV